jgi:hypothetical protein
MFPFSSRIDMLAIILLAVVQAGAPFSLKCIISVITCYSEKKLGGTSQCYIFQA